MSIKIQFSKKYNGLQTVWFYRLPSEGKTWIEIEDINEFIKNNDLVDVFELGGNYYELSSFSVEYWQTKYDLATNPEG